ncbi:FGGY family carbohydrate kinase, partial [Succinivibrio sp.]
MRYLLGVDLGTSGTKTVLFDEKGATVASKTIEYPLIQPKNGWAEQDPECWYHAAIDSIKAVLEESKIDSSDVSGLAIAGQMHGLVMLDEKGKV